MGACLLSFSNVKFGFINKLKAIEYGFELLESLTSNLGNYEHKLCNNKHFSGILHIAGRNQTL